MWVWERERNGAGKERQNKKKVGETHDVWAADRQTIRRVSVSHCTNTIIMTVRSPALSRSHPPPISHNFCNKPSNSAWIHFQKYTSGAAASLSHTRKTKTRMQACLIWEIIDHWAGRIIERPPCSPHPPAPQGLTVLFYKQQELSIDRANHWRQGLSVSLPLSPSRTHSYARTYTYRVIDTQWQKIYAVPPCLAFCFLSQQKRWGGGG